MARKTKSPEFFEELEPTRSEIDIEDFLEEWAPQTSVVEIYQRKPDGSLPHQQRAGIEILRADLYGYLREKFGSGKFVLQFKDSDRKIRKTLTVDVGAGEKVNGFVPVVVPPTDDFNKQLMLALIASIRPPDIGAMMAGLGAVMAALKPSAVTDPAAMLAAMAATFQQLKPAEDNVEKALKVIEMAKGIGGGGEAREENFYTVLKDVGKTVVEKFAPAPNGKLYSGGRIEPLANPPIQIESKDVPSKYPPIPESPDALMEKWLKAQLSFLKQKATAGKDVDFWVDYIFENQEEPGNQALLNAMDRGATFEHLLQFDPSIKENPVLNTWFGKLYEKLHAELNTAVDTAGPGGNAPDAGSDPKAGA